MHTLLPLLARNWSLILLRGILALVFGILAFIWPAVTLLTLVILFGVYAALDGVAAIAAAIRGGTLAPRWWLALAGVISLGAAAAAFLVPEVTAMVLVIFIGAWALALGVVEIIGAIQIRKEIKGEWLLILHGAVSALFGLMVLIRPGAGALALVWLIAVYAVLAGLLLIALALRLRSYLPAAVDERDMSASVAT
jgi:uncharacterized membrane protein HdeD (DUF308 family)